MLLVPSPLPTVNRRRVLIGVAALALLGATSAACGEEPPPPEVGELTSQLDRARADSALATEAAAAARGPISQALTEVASERAAHAQALSDELVRMVGTQAATTTPTTPTTTTAVPAKPPTAADVIGALRESANSTAALAARYSGYRAGLLGSISASCTAACTVALAPPEAQ
jgi:hypothetical protein